MSELELDAQVPRDRLQVFDAYARASHAFARMVDSIRDGADPWSVDADIAEAVRDLIDFALKKPVVLLETLSTVRFNAGQLGLGYRAEHAANTCVYSVLLGAQLGLVRSELAELGEAALCSDVALAVLPDACTERATPLSKDQRRELRRSTLQAAQLMLCDSPSRRQALRIIVAYEHGLPYRAKTSKTPANRHPYARIVAVASVYDALRSARPWRTPYLAAEAYQTISMSSETRFDPVVVEALRVLRELEATDDRILVDTEVRDYVEF